jgi:hypothetical protein
MRTRKNRRAMRLTGAGIVVLGCALFFGLLALPPADARPGGRGGGGARMNVGGGFNGPRSFSRPPSAQPMPSRPPGGGQRPSVGNQLPASPPSGLAPRPTPPIANAPPPSGVGRPPHPSHPIAGVPPQRPDGPGTTPPDRPVERPPGYYPPYNPAYWPPYPGYWPPPYPVYGDEYYGVSEPPSATPPADTVVSTLPADCRAVGVGDTTYMLCGSTWYAPRFSGNQLVYVVVAPPT